MDPAFQPLLDLLDRLPDDLGDIRDAVREAIRVIDLAPALAVVPPRKVLDHVIREVYDRRCHEPPGTRPLEGLVQRLVKDGHLPPRLEAYANAIRLLGNVGAHHFGRAITADDVQQSLLGLVPILEWYLGGERPEASGPRAPAPARPRPAAGPETRVAVVPKGLRSFDAADADFFLDLLPGPRDQTGLPESIRFWKQRVEATDEPAFSVGVLYGPSGCGKSSLVKAGLLPRLAGRVLSVHVAADRLLAAAQQNPSHYESLLQTLQPVRDRLLGPLSEVFRSGTRPDADRSWATSYLAEYAADRPDVLAGLLLDADARQFAVLWPKAEGQREPVVAVCEGTLDTPLEERKTDEEKERLGKRQANAAGALLRLDRDGKVWTLLKHTADPRARSYLIHRLSPLGADPAALVKRLEEEKEVSVRRALLLALGEFGTDRLPAGERERLVPRVLRLYREEPDAGLHGAAEWLLRQWQQEQAIQAAEQAGAKDQKQREGRQEQIRQELAKETGRGEGFWYINGQGQTMVVIHGPVEFRMGSPTTEAGRDGGPEGKLEQPHQKRIGRSYAIAAKEVTVAQFQEFYRDTFHKDFAYEEGYAPTADCPVTVVTWYLAAAYCTWLSKQEGIPENQWCYLPNDKGEYAEGIQIEPEYLSLTGYRLPTEAEWEYACRAGAVTSRYYGETEELLGKYAWYTKNSQDRWMLPAGRLKPNELGLFDMLGNAWQWCHDPLFHYEPWKGGKASEDRESQEKEFKDKQNRARRGGSFYDLAWHERSAGRVGNAPAYRTNDLGFRPARTVH